MFNLYYNLQAADLSYIIPPAALRVSHIIYKIIKYYYSYNSIIHFD